MDWKTFNKKTPKFSFQDLETECRIVSLYDGDTINIILPLTTNDNIGYRFSCRLNGIDTCERKNTNSVLKQISEKSIICLYENITGKKLPKDKIFKDLEEIIEKDLDENVYLLKVKCYQFDKYGRILLDIFLKDNTVSKLLLDNKLAYPYFGKTKLNEKQQLDFFNIDGQ
jgi:endonuclease YncB( thermonuclease family)